MLVTFEKPSQKLLMGTAEGTKELGSDVVMVRKLKYCYYKERTAVGADQKTNNEELLL